MADSTSLPRRLDPLIEAGIVGREQCPEEDYWSWPVLKPEELPNDLRMIYTRYGEIRWYPAYYIN